MFLCPEPVPPAGESIPGFMLACGRRVGSHRIGSAYQCLKLPFSSRGSAAVGVIM